MLLADRRCLVAGGGSARGIGAAAVRLFLDHGASVFVLDQHVSPETCELLREAGNQSPSGQFYAEADVRDPLACRAAVEAAVATLGHIDCLVNTIGAVASGPMLAITPSDFDDMLDVNLRGTFNLCQAVLAHYAERRSGSIVNVASVAAQRGGGLVGGAHYAAAKGGVVSLTRTIAREFGPLGIRANVVSPSMIATSMIDNVDHSVVDRLVEQVPLGRLGSADDVAGACLFLASDLSAYVTGAALDVNGGLHIH